MRPALAAVSVLVLPLIGAGCVPATFDAPSRPAAPVGPPRIAAVEASAGQVVIRISDGARCVGLRPEGVPGGWSGVTDPECGYALPYTVEFRQGGSPSRFVIESSAGVPVGPNGGPGPRAEVFVVDIDGQRKLFMAPLGPNVRFETQPPAEG